MKTINLISGVRVVVLAALMSLASVGANAAGGGGFTWIVTTTGDSSGACDPSFNCITLRDAINAANADSRSGTDIDTIVFSVAGTVTLTTGPLPAINTGTLLIDGSVGPGPVAIDGGKSFQVFNVAAGATLNLNSLTIQNGRAASGGGVANAGTLNVSNYTFTGNPSSGIVTNGGAVYNTGTLTVTNSTFSGNAAYGGGALYNSASGTATVTNSTLSGNTATFSGGGNVYNLGTVSLYNTILANGGSNCFNTGTLTADSSNMADDATCGSATVVSDTQLNLDPAGLASNGGPTQTIALLPGSIAIDAGNNAYAIGANLLNDQNGSPQIVGTSVDVGAFESTPPAALVCPGGGTFCSNAFTVPFSGSGTIGTVNVVTQGASGQDFTLDTVNSTCSSGTNLSGGCSVHVFFSPTAPGLRFGSVYLTDASGNVIQSANISGLGIGSALAFTPGILRPLTGGTTSGFAGDGGLASAAAVRLNAPQGMAVDVLGNVYIADSGNNVVRVINSQAVTSTILGISIPAGDIATVAGMPPPAAGGYSGDNGPATSATLNFPNGIALDNTGNLYIADELNNVVRKVTAATGVITTVAGMPPPAVAGFSGDGRVATLAQLHLPDGVVLDGAGNLFLSDAGNNAIRKVASASGIISTVAGTPGSSGYTGDGALATSATLNNPQYLALDSAGNLYFSDFSNSAVRKVTASTGLISTLPTGGRLAAPIGVAVDAAGDVYVADSSNNKIFKVNVAGVISTIASAPLSVPVGIALDSIGNIYIADANRSHELHVNNSRVPDFGSVAQGQSSSAQSVVASDIGNAPLNFTSLVPSTNFQTALVGGDCVVGTPLVVGVDCNLGAAFAPTAAGALTGTLTVNDNAFNTPQTVNLSGTGTAASTFTIGGTISGLVGTVALQDNIGDTLTFAVANGASTAFTFPIPIASGNPYSVTVSAQPVYSSATMLSQTCTVANGSGTANANVTNVTVTCTSNFYTLTTAVSPAGSGSVTPASASDPSGYTQALSASPNPGYAFVNWTGPVASATSPATTVTIGGANVKVTANFVAIGGLVISPTSLSFGPAKLGSILLKTVTLKNNGTSPITISSVKIPNVGDSDDFFAFSLCPSTLAGGKSCSIIVTFLADGDTLSPSGTLTITDSAAGSPQTVALTGTIISQPIASLSASSLSFSNQKKGTTSAAKTVVLKNTGTATLNITNVGISGPFLISSNTCTGVALAVNATCTVGVQFKPTAVGSASGTLTFTDNAPNSPQTVNLSGKGTP